ncbi:MAG: tRNA guanosine(34) transglycosylase Tgt [Bacteroidetes bacterium]|nr:tRNA guanosine(34) transglycosylase Tgt [Bacteroidota bacterium]
MFEFTILKKDDQTSARTGLISTAHGNIPTPIFMPVGTLGSVKAIHQHELIDPIAAKIILGNTYHLYLRPGTDILFSAGGLHKFMHWDAPLLTDSGGYQVYSLASQRKIKEEGVIFQSHIDGSTHVFTPEKVMDIQRIIGADIIMAFDECPPYPCDYDYAKKSMDLTHRWLKRCCARFDETEGLYGYQQTLFPIVQGSTYADLRKESAETIRDLDRAGNAIGGLSVGEPAEKMYETTARVCEILPVEKPRYLMGVGTPVNLLEGIALGIDMFDCVLPSRNARHGLLYTWNGVININNAKWKDNFDPIDPTSNAKTSQIYTKAYLRHLFKANEITAMQIATLHNLSFYLSLMAEARVQIEKGTFSTWKNSIIHSLDFRL